jgi:hypothetical protein
VNRDIFEVYVGRKAFTWEEAKAELANVLEPTAQTRRG